MKTRNTEKQMWHLQLDSGEAKHGLFGSSQAFCRLDTYLDDDITKQQLLGQRSWGSRRLQLKQLKTWWRRDTLCAGLMPTVFMSRVQLGLDCFSRDLSIWQLFLCVLAEVQ